MHWLSKILLVGRRSQTVDCRRFYRALVEGGLWAGSSKLLFLFLEPHASIQQETKRLGEEDTRDFGKSGVLSNEIYELAHRTHLTLVCHSVPRLTIHSFLACRDPESEVRLMMMESLSALLCACIYVCIWHKKVCVCVREESETEKAYKPAKPRSEVQVAWKVFHEDSACHTHTRGCRGRRLLLTPCHCRINYFPSIIICLQVDCQHLHFIQ